VGADGTEASQGSAYVFVESGGTWTQQAELKATDGAGQRDDFGAAVGLSGNTALIGAKVHNSTGAAYVFVRG
jgi:hypothetical protein